MSTNNRASVPATEAWALTSRNVRQAYRVSVARSPSHVSKSRKRYPTTYLLDANWHFGMVAELTRVMTLCGPFPEVIMVGIGSLVD
jgi:predicted alpha/beta superfamily hydrolase